MRRVARFVALGICVVVGCAALAATTAVAAPRTTGWGPGTDNLPDGWEAQAGSVTVTVDGAGVGGKRTASRTVTGPPPYCRYVPGPTAEEVTPESGRGDEAEPDWVDLGYDPKTRLPLDLEQRRGTPGRYWHPMCGGVEWVGDAASLEKYVADFFANNNTRWVGPDDPLPPPPPIPPDVLLEIAKEQLQPPRPQVNVNPAARSMVNLDTWVWTDPDTFDELVIRAESGPNWAQVRADPTGMALSAPAAARAVQNGDCASGGRPYSRGATTDCSITFGRSSAIAEGRTWGLTVTSRWQATGETSDGQVEELDGVVSPATTVQLPVAEVQALVVDRARG